MKATWMNLAIVLGLGASAAHAEVAAANTGTIGAIGQLESNQWGADSPSPGAEYGRAMCVLGARLYVGATGGGLVPAAGRVEVFDTFSGSQIGAIEAPPGAETGQFGSEVAAAHGLIAVSAPIQDGGRVHIYDAQSRAHLAELSSPESDAGWFGYRLRWLDEPGQLAVSAPVEQGGAGRVYLFDVPTQTVTGVIDNPDASGNTAIGAALDTWMGDLLVTATPRKPGFGMAKGALFRVDTKMGAIVDGSPAPNATEMFGISLAVVGDQVAVGSLTPASGSAQRSTVYLCDPATGQAQGRIAQPEGTPATWFGFALHAQGEFLYVGEPFGGSPACPDCGQVWVYDSVTSQIEGYAAPVEGQSGGQFGAALATFGETLFAGAPGQNFGGILQSGAAHQTTVEHPGNECSFAADLNGDGLLTISDLGCMDLVVDWALGASHLAAPSCLNVSPTCADLDCNGQVGVSDFLLSLWAATSGIPTALDADKNGIADACQM